MIGKHIWASVLGMVLIALLPMSLQAKTGCADLRDACAAAGFVGAGVQGKGGRIVRDCVNPLLSGVTPPGNGKLALPKVAAKSIAECKAARATKAKTEAAATNGKAVGNKPVAAIALPEGVDPGPNIVLVLVDDFSMNLMPDNLGELAKSMPNLAQMRREGMTFDNYFVTDSLCCPSRTSIFTGLFPHNSGVYTNSPPDGGLSAFMEHGNAARTFAVALHDGFYATAMMGKYLNGYQPEAGVPQGWSEWAVAGNGYANYNYTLNHNGTLIRPDLHMTDELAQLGQAFITSAAGPFFLELSTFSPHGPYVPPHRYAKAFRDARYPRSPAFGARPDAAAPKWLQAVPPLDTRAETRIDEIYRLRLQSVKGVDDMIGAIRTTLDEQGLAGDTYVIFTSDNGFHMGEYSLRPGKMTPFDTDIHMPLVIIGPGVAAGSRNGDITMNIDLYPTILDLAGLPAAPTVDGHSLQPALTGKPGPERTIAVIEHRGIGANPDDPDAPDPTTVDPPTYVALRMADTLYVEYLDGSGEVGFYDMKTDPDQLHNIAATLSKDRLQAMHEAATANHSCAGAADCGAAQALAP